VTAPTKPVTEAEIKATKAAFDRWNETMMWSHGHLALASLKTKHLLKVSRDTKFKSAAVDGRGVQTYDPDYATSIDQQEGVFVVAHENLHTLLRHHDRAAALGLITPEGGVTTGQEIELPRFWRACDMVINAPLVKDRVGRMPAGGLLPPDTYKGPLEAEALWYWLQQNEPPQPPPPPDAGANGGAPAQGCGPAETGQPPPSDEQGEGPSEAQSPTQGQGDPTDQQGPQGEAPGLSGDEIDQLRRDCEAMARQAGKGTHVADLLKPKAERTDWRAVLRSGFDKANTESSERTRKTYSRASRREALMEGQIKPGYIGEDPSVCVVFDVSGSVARDLVQKAAGECLKLASQYSGTRVYVVSHTSEVVWEGWLKAGGDVKQLIEATGFSGGTDAKPAYEAARKVKPKGFDALVHFTDCELCDPEWPTVPAKRFVIGACGLASNGVPHGTPPPPGARVIPVTVGAE